MPSKVRFLIVKYNHIFYIKGLYCSAPVLWLTKEFKIFSIVQVAFVVFDKLSSALAEPNCFVVNSLYFKSAEYSELGCDSLASLLSHYLKCGTWKNEYSNIEVGVTDLVGNRSATPIIIR